MRSDDKRFRLNPRQKLAEPRLGYTGRSDSGKPITLTPGKFTQFTVFLVELNMPDWKHCEGQLLDGMYPLERYVSSDEVSAVFLVGIPSAAVKIRRADAAQAAAFVQRWDRTKLLRHPHLLEVGAAGVSMMAGEPVAYLVTEDAEENLAEILDERPLTADETREMGLQVASALEYLHSRGMAHGDLKPSNILAIGDSIKLSSESVDEGDRTADIRALGFTLIHALTQRAQPLARGDVKALADLPAPFEEIAKGCLNPDPKHLWTASEIVARLRSPEHAGSSLPTSPPQVGKHAMARPRLLRIAGPATVVAVGLLVVASVVMRRTDAPSPSAVDRRLPLAAVAPGPVPPAPAAAPKTVAPVQPKERAKSTRDRLVIEDGVTHRVTPNIPQKVRDTIQGKPAVVVRVTADPMGNVTEAALDRSFSPYFSNFALQAARQWKFVPKEGASAREWILRFQFTPTNTQVFVERAVRE